MTPFFVSKVCVPQLHGSYTGSYKPREEEELSQSNDNTSKPHCLAEETACLLGAVTKKQIYSFNILLIYAGYYVWMSLDRNITNAQILKRTIETCRLVIPPLFQASAYEKITLSVSQYNFISLSQQKQLD